MGNRNFQDIRARGKTNVTNEPGQPLQVMESFGWLTIRDGNPLPVFVANFSIEAELTEIACIPAAEGFVTRIVSMHVIGDPATTTNLRFLSKGDGEEAVATRMSENYPVNGGFVLPRDGDGHMYDTLLNEGVVMTSGAGVKLVGCVKFVRIPADQFVLDNDGNILRWNDGTPVSGA